MEGNPSIKSTRQMRTQGDTTQKKKVNNQQKKIRQRPYAKRTHGYKMTINDNKDDPKQKSYHLPQQIETSDEGALTMMCEPLIVNTRYKVC